MLPDDPRLKFTKKIDLTRTRVLFEPHIIFICGGKVDVRHHGNLSVRNMFMNLSADGGEETDGFVLAENIKDWHVEYKSLSDFENDIAHISSLVVMFLESPGALTELGLFYANMALREKLLVVIHQDFHDSDSFIKFGILTPLEMVDQSSVRVYELDHSRIENVQQEEVKDVLSDVLEHCRSLDRTQKFDPEDRGHRIFLIFQLIRLYGALTKVEIKQLIVESGIEMDGKDVDTALYILERFYLVYQIKKSSQYFFYVKEEQGNRVALHFKSDDRRYDTSAAKIEVLEFYEEKAKIDSSYKRRKQVIEDCVIGGAS